MFTVPLMFSRMLSVIPSLCSKLWITLRSPAIRLNVESFNRNDLLISSTYTSNVLSSNTYQLLASHSISGRPRIAISHDIGVNIPRVFGLDSYGVERVRWE